jgi:hypothetical protein
MLLMGYGENIWGQEKPAAIEKSPGHEENPGREEGACRQRRRAGIGGRPGRRRKTCKVL